MFDWSDLAFTSKKPLRELKATLIAAPRKLSEERFRQLVKEQLPKGNVVLGIAKEPYVDGFEGQEHFKMLKAPDVQKTLDQIQISPSPHKLYILEYFQRELPYILAKILFKEVLLVNGSWARTFHTRPEFYELVKQKIPYRLVSPFADENEAKQYAACFKGTMPTIGSILTVSEMLTAVDDVANNSFDYSFQTGVVLGKKRKDRYELLAAAFNEVVPYQTFAMHRGASRETFFSPPNDTSHYDAVHAEVALILKAQKAKINLKDTAIFINLLPCPSCARMFTKTEIKELIYRQDHSDGYAVRLLELAGKKVTRIV